MCPPMPRNIPIITFDQPLSAGKHLRYLNVRGRISYMYRELRSFVLRLGFHTVIMVMSFLGSISHMMTGSGLQDAYLCQRCSQSYVLWNSSRKAIRGLVLFDASLNAMVGLNVQNCTQNCRPLSKESINTARLPEQPSWNDNSERNNQTQIDSQNSSIRDRSWTTKAAFSGAACRVQLWSHIRYPFTNWCPIITSY